MNDVGQNAYGYWIILGSEIGDSEAFGEYCRLWEPIGAKYDAEFIASSDDPAIFEGYGPDRIALVRFPSYQAALDCYNSPEYAAAKIFGQKASPRTFLVVKG